MKHLACRILAAVMSCAFALPVAASDPLGNALAGGSGESEAPGEAAPATGPADEAEAGAEAGPADERPRLPAFAAQPRLRVEVRSPDTHPGGFYDSMAARVDTSAHVAQALARGASEGMVLATAAGAALGGMMVNAMIEEEARRGAEEGLAHWALGESTLATGSSVEAQIVEALSSLSWTEVHVVPRDAGPQDEAGRRLVLTVLHGFDIRFDAARVVVVAQLFDPGVRRGRRPVLERVFSATSAADVRGDKTAEDIDLLRQAAVRIRARSDLDQRITEINSRRGRRDRETDALRAEVATLMRAHAARERRAKARIWHVGTIQARNALAWHGESGRDFGAAVATAAAEAGRLLQAHLDQDFSVPQPDWEPDVRQPQWFAHGHDGVRHVKVVRDGVLVSVPQDGPPGFNLTGFIPGG